MRIIAGRFKGRRFTPPSKNLKTRPTTDYARESLFNILQNDFDLSQCSFLDLFSGFGMISLEAASRGVEHIVVVEQNYHCVGFIKRCIEDLEIGDVMKIQKQDAFKYIAEASDSFDIVFADPPYRHPKMESIPSAIIEAGLVSQNGILIVEHDNKVSFDEHTNFDSMRKYGQSIFSFFST